MNIVRLKEDGTLHLKDRPISDDGLTCLGFQVELASGCTLRSFFLLLESHRALQRLNPFIPSYFEQYRKSPAHSCIFPGVDYLALGRIVEMTGYPGPASIRIYVSLDGIVQGRSCAIKSAGIQQLLDMPLQLGRLQHRVFGDQVDTLEFDTVFNLFELIDGICWELSFHNLPEQCRLNG